MTLALASRGVPTIEARVEHERGWLEVVRRRRVGSLDGQQVDRGLEHAVHREQLRRLVLTASRELLPRAAQ
jgi:hypothetical protein